MRLLALPLLLLAAFLPSISASRIYQTKFSNVTWDDDNWKLTTSAFNQGRYQSRISLANGYLGINLATTGPFFEVDVPYLEEGNEISGWPLFNRRQTFATIGGFWDYQPETNGTNFPWLNQYGGESVISGVPHWAGLYIIADGQVLDAKVKNESISHYSATLDIGTGSFQWKYRWTPANSSYIDVEYSMFLHKLHVTQAAIQLKMASSAPMDVKVVDVFEGDCAVRTDFVEKSYANPARMWSAVKPNGVENVTAYVYSTLDASADILSTRAQVSTEESYIGNNQSSIAQSVDVHLNGSAVTIEKYIGAASTDAWDDPLAVARNASLTGAKTGYKAMFKSHSEEWSSIMTDDKVDDFSDPGDNNLGNATDLLELQILAVTNPFFLLANSISANAIAAAGYNEKLNIHSISVCGLGSDCYGGLIFWDAEIWMAPGMVVTYPDHAQQIANYRVHLYPQAQENVKMAYSSSKNETSFSAEGAAFPWTSGRYGNCTGTGPCFDYEYHLNGDIGLELFNYYVATGDQELFKNKMFPIYDSIATFFADLVALNESLATEESPVGQYILTNATDPDEYANHVDNPGFTMPLMKTHMDTANKLRSWFGIEMNETWTNRSNSIYIPTNNDADIILEYGAMNGSISVKQADVVLIDDFLDFPNNYSNSNLDYYAGKQSPNGPGMTYGVFSIVANEISPSGCASYTYDLFGSQPYYRAPWYQYSEQLLDEFNDNGGTHPAYPFLTGMGGANRVTVFGYLGLRLFVDNFNVDPSLPPQIPYINYRTLYWQGHGIDVRSNQTHTTLARLPLSSSLPQYNATYAHNAIPVTLGLNYTSSTALFPNGTITLTNRRSAFNRTLPGNIAQCQFVDDIPDSQYVKGQFPLAAVDGAASTKWQPISPEGNYSMSVRLPSPFRLISGFEFDWGQAPPRRFYVAFSNSSIAPGDPNYSSAADESIVHVAGDDDVKVEISYNATEEARIVPYMSNHTSVVLDSPVWSGRWATLTVEGTHYTDNYTEITPGATVAEFSVLAVDGEAVEVGVEKTVKRGRVRRGVE
ncbi:carbohydrate-binding module family 32 protein [Aulographum hederae CBS 113979]|uniref:alpha,alpha-trehalase n=1 Tax=Aulographum hederae CBS 113979 TaxID=1176131 RepID=A0A6G1H2N9_9PEZI|nr:carbohydrate-binding module family 32 protein [Aulographum hederae CBS 113979]